MLTTVAEPLTQLLQFLLMPSTDSDFLEALYEALNSELGVIIREESGNATVLRQRLYSIRKDHPELSCISIVQSPINPEHELYLVRKPNEPDADN